MRNIWVNILEAAKEAILISLLVLILTTMVGGFILLGVLNVPQHFWQFQGIYAYLGISTTVFAPVFALARVIEWWINTYKRFSSIFQHKEQS